MKKIFILFSIFLLCGCNENDDPILFSSIDNNGSEEIKHDYYEINHLLIDWDEIFCIEKTEYYVYIYSRNCSHCNSIKNKIISFAIAGDCFYFVEDSQKILFKTDIKYTIGLTSADNLSILGFPSLLKISNKVLTKNIAGTEKILSELKI